MPAKRSARYPQGAGAYVGGVGTLNQAQGNVLLPPGGTGRLGIDWSSAHTYAWLFGLILPAAWLFARYYVHGGRRGGIF